MTIEIVPVSSRAKNRVREHGSTFDLVRLDMFRGERSMLVRCIKTDCQCEVNTEAGTDRWLGWFAIGKDVEIE